MSASSNRPTCIPIFDLGIVVILSTINRLSSRKPLRGVGSTASRNNGPPVPPVVKEQTVMERVSSKPSS